MRGEIISIGNLDDFLSRDVAVAYLPDPKGAKIRISAAAGNLEEARKKPVGTVWIGFWSDDRHFAVKALFTNDRLINKERSAAVALDVIRRTVENIETMPYGLKPHFA